MYLFENTYDKMVKDSKNEAEKFRIYCNEIDKSELWIILGYDIGNNSSKGFSVIPFNKVPSLIMDLKEKNRKQLCFYQMIIPPSFILIS